MLLSVVNRQEPINLMHVNVAMDDWVNLTDDLTDSFLGSVVLSFINFSILMKGISTGARKRFSLSRLEASGW
jgi:hypothetical protein